MSMTDGNPTQNITATVDPRAVAQIVHEMQQAQVATQKKESRFQQKINSLLQSGNVDKENLSEIADLTQRAIEDAKEEMKSNSAPDMVRMTQARYNDAISDALDKYIEGDEPLEKSAKLLEYNITEKIKANSSLMDKLNRGELDKRQIGNIAKEVVEAFSKDVLKRDQSPKGPAIKTGVPGTTASQAIENSPVVGSIDEIEAPHRREAYNKFKAMLTRNRVPADKAHEKAFTMATKQYKKQGTAA